jgi:hypothetical protein
MPNPTTVVLVHGVCRRRQLGTGHRAARSGRRAGDGERQPAARRPARCRLRRQRHQPDRRARARRRTVLRRHDHHQCRSADPERRGSGLRRGVRTGPERNPGRHRRQVEGQRSHHGGDREAVPDRHGQTAAEFIIDAAKFREVCTADLPQLESDVYGLSQRPIAASALADETGHPAWKDHRVWAAVGTGDKAAGADVVRSMAQRANAEITEIEGSHVIMISQPAAVTDVILTALKVTS